MAEYESKTIDELQDLLRERELKVSGSKDELVARLELSDLAAEEPDAVTEEAAAEAGVEPEDVAPAEPPAPTGTGPHEGTSDKEAPTDEAEPEDSSPEEAPAERDPNLGVSTADVPARTATTAAVSPAVVQHDRAVKDKELSDEAPQPVAFSRSPQSQPEAQSPEVAGYTIMPDGRRVKLEQPEDQESDGEE